MSRRVRRGLSATHVDVSPPTDTHASHARLSVLRGARSPLAATYSWLRELYITFTEAISCNLLLHHKERNLWGCPNSECIEYAWVSIQHARRDAEAVLTGGTDPPKGGSSHCISGKRCQIEEQPLPINQRGKVAVCLLGMWRTLPLTAPSIRSFVLDPLDADAYGLIQVPESKMAIWGSSECEGLLGPRIVGRCIVGTAKRLRVSVYNQTAVDHLMDPDGDGVTCKRRSHQAAMNQALVWLQQDACHSMVQAAEQRGGFAYAAYMRIRTDLLFFQPPVQMSLQGFLLDPAANAHVALVPSGDEWQSEDELALHGESTCDNILVGGRHAFMVDAKTWEQATDISPACFPGWIGETFLRDALRAGGVNTIKQPMAYCKLGVSGACRYAGQLATSLGLVPTLLEGNSGLAQLVCNRPTLEQCGRGGRPARDSIWPQPIKDWKRDPHYCQLRRMISSACSSPPLLQSSCQPDCRRNTSSGGDQTTSWHNKCTRPDWVARRSCTACRECRQLSRCCRAHSSSGALASWVQEGARWCRQESYYQLQAATPSTETGVPCNRLGCGYRLADAIFGKYGLARAYSRSIPRSLAGRYGLRLGSKHNLNMTLLHELLADVPTDLPVVASMHVRTEDVIDDFSLVHDTNLGASDFLCAPRYYNYWSVLPDAAGLPQQWARFVPTLEFYKRVADALLARQVRELSLFAGGSPLSKETLKSPNGTSTKHSTSCSYLYAVQAFFVNAGINATVQWRGATWWYDHHHHRAMPQRTASIDERALAASEGDAVWQSADRALATMTRARYFIPTGGGYSALAEMVVRAHGRGEVLRVAPSSACM